MDGLRRLDKKVGFLQRSSDAATGYVEVAGVYLDAGELASQLDSGNASGAGTHEGV